MNASSLSLVMKPFWFINDAEYFELCARKSIFKILPGTARIYRCNDAIQTRLFCGYWIVFSKRHFDEDVSAWCCFRLAPDTRCCGAVLSFGFSIPRQIIAFLAVCLRNVQKGPKARPQTRCSCRVAENDLCREYAFCVACLIVRLQGGDFLC
jgi:hypothetical protein